jgi:hypothetical protein
VDGQKNLNPVYEVMKEAFNKTELLLFRIFPGGLFSWKLRFYFRGTRTHLKKQIVFEGKASANEKAQHTRSM